MIDQYTVASRHQPRDEGSKYAREAPINPPDIYSGHLHESTLNYSSANGYSVYVYMSQQTNECYSDTFEAILRFRGCGNLGCRERTDYTVLLAGLVRLYTAFVRNSSEHLPLYSLDFGWAVTSNFAAQRLL